MTTVNARSKQESRAAIARQLIAGGVAGAVSRTVVSPLERVKILFQIQGAGTAKYQGVLPTLARVYREEGVTGYFKGNGTNCVRIIPYSAVQFATYEELKRWMLARRPGAVELETRERLLGGALAGVASVVSTYPLDIARTRLSVLGNNDRLADGNRASIWRICRQIYRTENGIWGLYRGVIPTLLGVAPYVGLNFTCYETLRAWFTPVATAANPHPQPSIPAKLFCGGLAGAIAQTCTYPLDLIRRRFQVMDMSAVGLERRGNPVDNGKGATFGYRYTSTWDAIRSIVRTEGPRGLYKGCLPNYLKVIPAISASFVSYEQTKLMLETCCQR